MSAPFFWIILPGLFGVGLFLMRSYPRFLRILGIVLSTWLWLLAALLPVGELVEFAGRIVFVNESLSILGREFVIANSDRPLVALLYFFLLIWNLGAVAARPRQEFVGFSYVVTAVLTAALAVEPFLYAALLIEIVVLVSVPLLSPPDLKPGKGIFRFLAFQTLGMPFILISGDFLAGLEASPGQTEIVLRAGVFIGIGFAFLLAVVPFHTWIPSLAEESEPYTTAFILFSLPMLISIFGLGFLDRFIWLRGTPQVYQGLQLVGVLMVLVGGLWAAVENHLGRILGYATIAETGMSLLAIGIASPEGVLLFFWLVVMRVLSLVAWAAGLSFLKQKTEGEMSLPKLHGIGHFYPLAVIGMIVAQFSLFGIPFLAGFSARLALWRLLAPSASWISAVALVGNVGLLIAVTRTLNVLFISLPEDENFRRNSTGGIISQDGRLVTERLFEWSLFGVVVFLFAVFGLFPKLYLPALERLLTVFNQIGGG